MKKTILSICAVAFFACGCTSVDKLFPTRSEAILHADGSPVTKPVVLPDGSVTNAPQFATVLEPSPTIEATVATLKAVPLPYVGTAGYLLGIIAAGYVAVRNKKALAAVVDGIEAGREWLQRTPEGRRADEVLKDFLIEHQEAAGVLNAVGKIVNERTGNTVKPSEPNLL